MEIAVLGLKQSGKSTLFQIMTGVNSAEIYGESLVRGIANIPDDRFSHLVETFKPAKVTPATVPFVDVSVSGEKGFDSVRSSLSSTDGILHIVDCFTTEETQEMVNRYRQLEDELILSDLLIIERRIEKLSKLPKDALKQDETIQLNIMPGLKEQLEAGKALREIHFSKEETEALKHFSFLSEKPELVVLNISEGAKDPSEEFQKIANLKEKPLSICCQIELEISSLPENEQKEFLDSLGIETPAFINIVHSAFASLRRIYYFTVGEDEVRAWVIQKDSTAPKAASAIHKDFERGFIRAEVVSYKDFVETGNSIASSKSAGKLRLEGKSYIVQDGDIISFLFNV